jgi:hypothetical protein
MNLKPVERRKEFPMRRSIQFLSVCLLAIAMSCVAQAKENEKEEAEVKVKFADLPQVVQTTFEEESRGATITEVEKETEKGEIVYEAENVEIKGKKYDIEVAEDGTLIEKSLADGDEDDAEDDD